MRDDVIRLSFDISIHEHAMLKAACAEAMILWNSSYPLAVKPWVVHWENIKTFFLNFQILFDASFIQLMLPKNKL